MLIRVFVILLFPVTVFSNVLWQRVLQFDFLKLFSWIRVIGVCGYKQVSVNYFISRAFPETVI